MSWIVGFEGVRGALPDGCAATIGVFDGVHRGHAMLIAATTRWARTHGVPAVAVTFDPHPAALLAPQHCPPLLCTLAHRVERMLQQGIDYVIVQPFTPALAQQGAEEFIDRVLNQGLKARAVVVGDDFRFGQGRKGSVETLRAANSFEVITVASISDESGERISSTRIRALIQAGELEQASVLLGEPLHWTGVAVRGDGRGRGFGYPTANLVPIEPLITPPSGVYACLARLHRRSLPSAKPESERLYPAAVSVGKPPMFENARGRIEAHLIGFTDRDLYGCVMTLQFLKRLRPQYQFNSVDALLEQMAHDVEQTRQLVQEVQSER